MIVSFFLLADLMFNNKSPQVYLFPFFLPFSSGIVRFFFLYQLCSRSLSFSRHFSSLPTPRLHWSTRFAKYSQTSEKNDCLADQGSIRRRKEGEDYEVSSCEFVLFRACLVKRILFSTCRTHPYHELFQSHDSHDQVEDKVRKCGNGTVDENNNTTKPAPSPLYL